MSRAEMYVRIVGEPFLSRAKEYREKLHACHTAWRVFADERGADQIPGGLSGLIFHDRRKVPTGWKAPDRKGWSHPKKGHPDAEVIAGLPKEPNRWDVFRGAIIGDLSYKGPDSWGSGAIGHFFFGPHIGWAGDTFLAVIPDAKAAADKHLAEHPDHEITNGADTWVLPAGLERITKAEHDLIIAQYTVEQERAEKSEAA